MTEKPTIHELEAILDNDTPGTVSIQPDGSVKVTTLLEDIQSAINRHSAENASNTPDFILAQYLEGCLATFNTAVQQRETWYGRDPRPSGTVDQLGTLESETDPCNPNLPGHEVAGHVSPSTT